MPSSNTPDPGAARGVDEPGDRGSESSTLHAARLGATATVPDEIATADHEAPTPQRIGRYTVLGELGRGGMGTVLEAFDAGLDRKVALKLLHRDIAERHTKRLVREAKALAMLSHPNVVQVFDVGVVEGRTFVAMELVDGQTLGEWRKQRRRSWRACVQVYLQAAEGLHAAHQKGLVHRDFKPGNCIIDPTGRVRVLDFGLVRNTSLAGSEDSDPPAKRASEAPDDIFDEDLTRTGAVLGTVAYMPLEQFAGQADARSDQFSFCVALYEALYGERPFGGTTVAGLVYSMQQGNLEPPRPGAKVPFRLRRVLVRGLSAKPEDRWPSMQALSTELSAIVRPRWARWTATSLALGVAGTAAVVLVRPETATGPRCEGAREALEGIWDDERRRQVEAAILGTRLPYADNTWRGVGERMDEYARGWVAAYEDTCRATLVRHEQSEQIMDLRMACLSGRRIALRDTADVLMGADEAVVTKAIDVVSNLPSLSRCDDVEALRVDVPPPEDPRVAQRVQQLRERLSRAHTLEQVGDYDESLAVISEIFEQIVGIEYPPLRAEALLRRARVMQQKGRYPEAERDLQDAYMLAASHQHEWVEADAAGGLTWVIGVSQARHEEGLQWGGVAQALAQRPHASPQTQFRALNSMGNVLMSQGELDEALSHFHRALDLLRAAPELDDTFLAGLWVSAGNVLLLQGKFDEARQYNERALAIQESVLGPEHPTTASARGNIGTALYMQGELEDAMPYLEGALATSTAALGPDHPAVARIENTIGSVLGEQGSMDEALRHFEHVLEIHQATLGPDHPECADALGNIGIVLKEQGRLREARSHFERALAIHQATLGPDHFKLTRMIDQIGSVLEQEGKLEDARSYYERELKLVETTLGRKSPRIARPVLALARLALAQGETDTAREYAEHIVSLGSSGDVIPEYLADARFVLARTLWPDRSQRARARALARQAHDAYAELGRVHHENLAKTRAWLDQHDDG